MGSRQASVHSVFSAAKTRTASAGAFVELSFGKMDSAGSPQKSVSCEKTIRPVCVGQSFH